VNDKHFHNSFFSYFYHECESLIYYIYMYYSSGWLDYVLLLLELIMHTHLLVYQIFLEPVSKSPCKLWLVSQSVSLYVLMSNPLWDSWPCLNM